MSHIVEKATFCLKTAKTSKKVRVPGVGGALAPDEDGERGIVRQRLGESRTAISAMYYTFFSSAEQMKVFGRERSGFLSWGGGGFPDRG